MSLKNKKILLISVSFFNYEKVIAERLKELGAEVTFVDERPSNSIFVKGIIRLKRSFYQTRIHHYYKKVLVTLKNKPFDYLLLIKGEVVPPFFLAEIKALNPQIVTLYYTYDSFKNNPNATTILHFFDRKFTFDRKDALDFRLHFRPLFFSKEYEAIRHSNSKAEFDTIFIGSAHTDRYMISEQVKQWCSAHGMRSFAFYFSPSKLVFLYKKFFDPLFKGFEIKKINFRSLRHTEIIRLYQTTKAVLDINHPWQKGLTMRTFEALGAGRKLITTNPEIKSYPFYNAQNILIIDRNQVHLNTNFFDTDFVSMQERDYYHMSLDGWIQCLFFKPQDDYWTNKHPHLSC